MYCLATMHSVTDRQMEERQSDKDNIITPIADPTARTMFG